MRYLFIYLFRFYLFSFALEKKHHILFNFPTEILHPTTLSNSAGVGRSRRAQQALNAACSFKWFSLLNKARRAALPCLNSATSRNPRYKKTVFFYGNDS